MAKAVFLDRDETLNPDPGYINDPVLFDLYPWIPGELNRLKNAGFLLIIVTNQSGINRGLIERSILNRIHKKLDALLIQDVGFAIDYYAVCPHTPEEKCPCRKPRPTLILQAAEKFNIDLKKSFMIGDRTSDYEAGMNAGVRKSFLIKQGDSLSFMTAINEILADKLKTENF